MSLIPPLAGIPAGSATATIPNTFFDDILDASYSSCCSTPYACSPSSPGQWPINNVSYFYSAPTSPMHFLNSSASASGSKKPTPNTNSFEFDFSGPITAGAVISSADELFLNGKIRPMKLSSHLQRPQNLAPLIDLGEEEEDGDGGDGDQSQPEPVGVIRGRDLKKLRERSLRRRARSLSPLRTEFCNNDDEEEENTIVDKVEQRQKIDGVREGTKFGPEPPSISSPPSASSSRSSSSGRNNSNRWIFLKDFIRSKSDGSGTATRQPRFWSSISFSNTKSSSKPTKEKSSKPQKGKMREEFSQTGGGRRLKNGVEKRPSAHEVHYTAKRAQAEEMRRKTFLPYRQGLLGCLGFSSKGYGAMDGFARALNASVSSR